MEDQPMNEDMTPEERVAKLEKALVDLLAIVEHISDAWTDDGDGHYDGRQSRRLTKAILDAEDALRAIRIEGGTK
jgi:hypothetical protein